MNNFICQTMRGGAQRRRPFSFYLLLIAALAMVWALPGCAKKPSAPTDNALARVNGQAIAFSDFVTEYHTARQIDLSAFTTEGMDELAVRKAFLDQLIERTLVEQEAAKLSVEVPEQQVELVLQGMQQKYPAGRFEALLAQQGDNLDSMKKRIRQTLLADQVAARLVLPNLTITEEQLQLYFQEHPDQFAEPEKVQARQILCRTEADAIDALTEVLTGRDFAEVAKVRSVAPEGKNGGDLGLFARGEMLPEMEEAAFRLPVGEISTVIQTPFGFHIIQVTQRLPQTSLTYEQAQATIRTTLRKQQADRAWRAYLDQLKNGAEIVIDHSRLLDF